jgi:hypothetical protein
MGSGGLESWGGPLSPGICVYAPVDAK